MWVQGFEPLSHLSSPACSFFPLGRFMEFEVEEETQIQNAQLMNGSPGLSPVAPLKLDPPGSMVPEACQQPGEATHNIEED